MLILGLPVGDKVKQKLALRECGGIKQCTGQRAIVYVFEGDDLMFA
jgi:hypothetical protein